MKDEIIYDNQEQVILRRYQSHASTNHNKDSIVCIQYLEEKKITYPHGCEHAGINVEGNTHLCFQSCVTKISQCTFLAQATSHKANFLLPSICFLHILLSLWGTFPSPDKINTLLLKGKKKKRKTTKKKTQTKNPPVSFFNTLISSLQSFKILLIFQELARRL